jgi:acyl carrier protein
MLPTILNVIQSVAGIQGLAPEQDFYEAGVTSIMALPLLMELEAAFNVSIPDQDFINARTPLALAELIARGKEAA